MAEMSNIHYRFFLHESPLRERLIQCWFGFLQDAGGTPHSNETSWEALSRLNIPLTFPDNCQTERPCDGAIECSSPISALGDAHTNFVLDNPRST